MVSEDNLREPQIPADSKSEWSSDIHEHLLNCKGGRAMAKAI